VSTESASTISLADFDPVIVSRYGVTQEKLALVVRYVRLLQGEDAPTLADIALGGYYGTAALLHEVVELDILLRREPGLLEMSHEEARRCFHAHLDAHAEALVSEHQYLQRQIERCFGAEVSLGALVVANAGKRDFEILLASTVLVPIFEPTPQEVDEAERLLEQLRSIGRGWYR